MILLQEHSSVAPQEDLAHILLRWKLAGLQLYSHSPSGTGSPQPLTVKKPSNFRSLLHLLAVTIGLRPNSAGGFGGLIPQPSSSGSYG